MDPVAILIAAGIFGAAALYSAVGHGGASGYLAILALAGFSIGEMRPTALCLNLLVASLAWLRFARMGAFSWRLLLPFAVTSIPAAFFGGKIGLDSSLAFTFLGITLMLAAASLVRPWTGPSRGSAPPPLAIALVAYWMIFGSVFWAYLEVMERPVGWLAATGGFVLSWRIGLFTVVAPQGLGVFEPTFVALVGWATDALLLVGTFRVVLVLRDLALTALAAMVSRRKAV